MTKIKFFQKDTTKKDIVLGILLVLGLIWLNTFIHQNSFSDTYGDFYFLHSVQASFSFLKSWYLILKYLVMTQELV